MCGASKIRRLNCTEALCIVPDHPTVAARTACFYTCGYADHLPASPATFCGKSGKAMKPQHGLWLVRKHSEQQKDPCNASCSQRCTGSTPCREGVDMTHTLIDSRPGDDENSSAAAGSRCLQTCAQRRLTRALDVGWYRNRPRRHS